MRSQANLGASTSLCHETSVLLLAARRHFWHDGSAVSTCSRRTKSPHSVQAAPSGASLVGSVMWVFGFAIEIGRLTTAEATTALWRSTPGASCESYWASRGDAATGAIVGVEGKRIRTPGAVA